MISVAKNTIDLTRIVTCLILHYNIRTLRQIDCILSSTILKAALKKYWFSLRYGQVHGLIVKYHELVFAKVQN